MKRAYLVTGPESAGNRILAACLVRAGCFGAGSTQHIYQKQLPDGVSPVVLIRSMPHGGDWLDLRSLRTDLENAGYNVTVLVTVRHPAAVAASQVWRGHVPVTKDAFDAIRKAYSTIVEAMYGAEWYMVPVESLCGSPKSLAALLELLELPPVVHGPLEWEGVVQDGRIKDMNQKHFVKGDSNGA